MSPPIVSRAFEVFQIDAAARPPLTLRGGNAVTATASRSVRSRRGRADRCIPRRFAFWGLGSLDARFVAPLPTGYRLRVQTSQRSRDGHRGAGAIAASARSVPAAAGDTQRRPGERRAIVPRAGRSGRCDPARAGRRAAGPRGMVAAERAVRPTAQETAALRAAPWPLVSLAATSTRCRCPRRSRKRRSCDSAGIAARADVGWLSVRRCSHVVAVNVTPLDVRSLADSVRARTTLFRDTVSPR